MSRGAHGAYRLRLCFTCGFAIPANHWALHRRRHDGIDECPACRGKHPCQRKTCPLKEPLPIEVADEVPGAAPTEKLVRSLRMNVQRRSDGKWSIRAPWLKDTVIADTWEDAYWLAMRRNA